MKPSGTRQDVMHVKQNQSFPISSVTPLGRAAALAVVFTWFHVAGELGGF